MRYAGLPERFAPSFATDAVSQRRPLSQTPLPLKHRRGPYHSYFPPSRRHARNRLAFCLSVRGFVRPSIGEALADDAFQQSSGALFVVNAKRRTLIVAEIKFSKIALQVLLADVVIGADDAALEDGEISFNAIGMSVAANVFISAVIYRFVAVKLFARMVVLSPFVRHQRRFAADLRN